MSEEAAAASVERRKRLTLMACILGSAVAFVDSTVVNVGLPAIAKDLDVGLSTQQWVVEAYLLTLSAFILVGGSLGDLFGRKRIFTIGIAAFGVCSLLCAVAPSGNALIFARGLQGLAGALLVPSTLAIITATFGDAERGAAIGSWTAWTGISILIGPPIGGALIDLFSWRVIFAINVPLVLITLYLIHRNVDESADPLSDRRVDFTGAALCALGLAGPVYALIEQPRQGWGDPTVAIPLILGVVFLIAFVIWEGRSRHPMLPLALFKSRNFTAANATTFALYAGLGAFTFFLTIFIQQVGGYSATAAGTALAPTTVIMFFFSRRFGALADRVGPRPFMTIGPIVAAGGLLWLMRADEDVSYLTDLLPSVLLFGFGLSMTVAPLTATVLGAVEQRHAGVASGVNNAVARISGLLAVAAIGAVVATSFTSQLDDNVKGRTLSAREQRAVETAKDRPLAGRDDLPAGTRTSLGPAVEDASVSAFHLGVGIAALLMVAAGVIAAAGIESKRRREVEPGRADLAIALHPCPDQVTSEKAAVA